MRTPLCSAAALSSALIIACDGGSETEPPPEPTDCAADELALPDGSCIRPGIAPDGCAEGFVHDGDRGCEPILPPTACPPGQIAVPGDASCRPVMPCAPGRWGDIPRDASTEHVDASYTGGNSDGSEQRPFVRIADAVMAAQAGAIIAVAAGSYTEDISLSGKAVRIWGVCPEQVEIVGSTPTTAALMIVSAAHGTEVRGLAVRGSGVGILVTGSLDVVLDRLWVHDAGWRGIALQSVIAPVSASVRDCLIESTRDIGMSIAGADVQIDGVVVRLTMPYAVDQSRGRGITVTSCEPLDGCNVSVASHVAVSRSLVEDNRDAGVWVSASELVVEASVVRRTIEQAMDGRFGRGVGAQACTAMDGCAVFARSHAELRGSLLDENVDGGVFVSGSEANLDSMVVRRTLASATLEVSGRGVSVQDCRASEGCSQPVRSTAMLTGSLVSDSHDIGVYVAGSDLQMERSVIRRTLPEPKFQMSGLGLTVQIPCTIQGCDGGAPATAAIRASLIEDNREVAVLVTSSDMTLDGVVVRRTLPEAARELFGDGVALFAFQGAANGTMTNSRVDDSARAGVSNFGGTLSLTGTDAACAAFPLHGEDYMGSRFTFLDGGGNRCGCPPAADSCRASSVALQPPEPPTDSE